MTRRRNWWKKKRQQWKNRKRRDWGCADSAGDGCDGCDVCDLNFFMILATLFVAGLHYFQTAPVREGRRLARPALRLIRSYQQHVSAHRPAVCNLSPTCSTYGYTTIREQGLRGIPAVRQRLRDCGDTGRTKRAHTPG